MSSDFEAWAQHVRARMERVLDAHLVPADIVPVGLHQAMRYAVLGGGKRTRPLLVFAAGEVSGASADRLEVAAAAVELIHAYSLVHDDLPCMDDDVLRRGKPTCHVQFGEAAALLAGDALQALAFRLLAAQPLADEPAAQLEMIGALAAAAGSRGMAGGQAIDLDSVGCQPSLPELEAMHVHKTGALIRCAVDLGARCGRPLAAQEYEHLDRYAKCMGLAFQVVDDVLDAASSTATLGKTAGKDALQNKPTYVTALGIEGARELAGRLHAEALAELAGLGPRAARLAQAADFVTRREF